MLYGYAGMVDGIVAPAARRARREMRDARHRRPGRRGRAVLQVDRRGRRPAHADRPAADLGAQPRLSVPRAAGGLLDAAGCERLAARVCACRLHCERAVRGVGRSTAPVSGAARVGGRLAAGAGNRDGAARRRAAAAGRGHRRGRPRAGGRFGCGRFEARACLGVSPAALGSGSTCARAFGSGGAARRGADRLAALARRAAWTSPSARRLLA